MTLRLLTLLLFAPFAGAQTVVLAGGGGEGDVGDTAAWSYGLYGALVENGDTDGDGVIRVAVVSRNAETPWLPGYFEWLGAERGLTVDAANVRVSSRGTANSPTATATLATADVIFLKGGDQGAYYDLWNDTLVEAHVRALVAGGGAVGGTSAGAMSLAEHCLCGGRDLISADVMKDARTDWMDDASEPGTSGIHSDFLGVLPGVTVETHYTERGRLGRMLGVLAATTEQAGTDAVLAVGVERQTGVVIRDGVATVHGEGAVAFVRPTGPTLRVRDAGEPLVYTHLRLDRLTDGWAYHLARRRPVLDPLPEGAEAVSFAPGGANSGPLRIFGDDPNGADAFAWVATHDPSPYTLTPSTASVVVRDAVGFTGAGVNDGHRGDRQETLFRALYDHPEALGVLLFDAYDGAAAGALTRRSSTPDRLFPAGEMATIVVDGSTMTHKGLAPTVNRYGVRSAALVNARLHVLAPAAEYRFLQVDTRTRRVRGTHPALHRGSARSSIVPMLSMSPNPARDSVRFDIEAAGAVTVEIVDALGRRVRLASEGAGSRTVTVDVGDLPSGVYSVRVAGDGERIATPLTVVR